MKEFLQMSAEKELTRPEALRVIESLSKMDLVDFKKMLEQIPKFLKKVYKAFSKYLDSSDESRNKIHESVHQVLDIISKYLDKAPNLPDAVINDILEMAKELVTKEIESIRQIEENKWRVFWCCAGWSAVGILLGAAGGLFLGNYCSREDIDGNDKRA